MEFRQLRSSVHFPVIFISIICGFLLVENGGRMFVSLLGLDWLSTCSLLRSHFILSRRRFCHLKLNVSAFEERGININGRWYIREQIERFSHVSTLRTSHLALLNLSFLQIILHLSNAHTCAIVQMNICICIPISLRINCSKDGMDRLATEKKERGKKEYCTFSF